MPISPHGVRLLQVFNMKFKYIALFLIIILLSSTAHARIYIDINAPSLEKYPLALPAFIEPGNQGKVPPKILKELHQVLVNDLSMSGFFEILNPNSYLESPSRVGLTASEIKFSDWTTIGAEGLVKGGLQISGRGDIIAELRLFDVSQQKQVVGKRYSGPMDEGRKMIHRFADQVIESLTGNPGFFNSKIAFVSDARGNKEIYAMDFDGYNTQAITNNPAIDITPSWSPSGNQIIFTSFRKNNPDLYIYDFITRGFTLFSDKPGINIAPAWSPNGKNIIFTASFDGDSELYLANTKGAIIERLTKNWGIDVSADWAPDGKSIVFSSNRSGSPQIYTMEIDTGAVRRLTFAGMQNVDPAWSPRGDKITFCGRDLGFFDIFVMNANGTNIQRLTIGQGNNENPVWSPDGRALAFCSNRTGKHNIFFMLADGSSQRQLTNNLGNCTNPSWSPRLK